MNNSPLTTEDALLNEFFEEVENRIPSNSTQILNQQFCIFCSAYGIPPADRELLAQSIFDQKVVVFSSSEVEVSVDALLNIDFVKLMLSSIDQAAREKKTITELREKLAEFDTEKIKKHIQRRLKDRLCTLATETNPFIITKINNLIDESPRLRISAKEVNEYVKLLIENDPLLNTEFNEEAKEILRYIK